MATWQFWTLIGLNALIGLYVVSTLSAIDSALQRIRYTLDEMERRNPGQHDAVAHLLESLPRRFFSEYAARSQPPSPSGFEDYLSSR